MPTKAILYIDDEIAATRSYRDRLVDAGYEVIPRRTADSGLQFLLERTGEVDILVLDMMMPEPEGVEAAELQNYRHIGLWVLARARQVIEDRSLPVIVLTNANARATASLIINQVLLLPESLVTCHSKYEVSAKDLPALVAARLGSGPEDGMINT